MGKIARKLALSAALLCAAAFGARWAFHALASDLVTRAGADRAEFAGVRVPMEGADAGNRAKLAKEMLVARYNDYQFLLYLARAPKYFPEFSKTLAKYGVPDDFKYLAVAESALRVDAASDAGAAGPWQLMPDTARQYGLRVDSGIDERLHVAKSTDAAARYLAYLGERFGGDWAMAAAAYNRGHNGLSRDLAAQPGAKGYWDLYLNEETSRYLYRVVAIKYLMLNAGRFFDADDVPELPDAKLETTVAEGPVADLAAWAAERGISYARLREYNPWVRRGELPEGRWELSVPSRK